MSDLSEVKKLIQDQGQAWEEFKRTNDELIKAKADGKAVGDLEAKLAKISADMDQISELKSQIEEVATKLNRPNLGSSKPDTDLAAEAKSFNLMRRANAQAGARVDDIDEKSYVLYKNAFNSFVRKGNLSMLSADEQKAMQAGVDSDGGYLLPSPTVGAIAKKVYELSPIRQIANVMTISTDALEGLNDLDEATCGWVSETGTRSDSSTPTVGKYRIEAHEMYSMPKITQKLLDDAAIDVEAWLAAKVADKFARTEAAAFITGNGVGQPRGFTDYPTAATADSSRSWGVIEHVKTGASGAFHTTQADPLFELIGAFKTAYLANARWVTRREVITAIRKFKTTTTLEYIWQPGLQVGQPDRLLGYPIVIAQDMPALASGSNSMYFGDFKQAYTIIDRIGIRTLRDPYTAKPYVMFYSTRRVGGGLVNSEAIKAINFAS
jgi:HK97 family phage major capsid protein